ncbi:MULTISPECIES: hypothetical protein [Polaribacter]|uniref:DUF3149 domain-containing protein n=1 Tax=Polaribacter marinaquae TaxID=1642819 RepID=A0ABZ2TP71_9FLAO|nr:hypothetical protein [Polaribacter sp. KT 15]SHM87206.1 hypothetical protein SAMN05720268_1098 [Polaribacter sp. KT 15]
MDFLNFPLVSWVNGTVMIGVFAVVVIGLIAAIFLLINSDKKVK